jgi:hypothetical protein
MMSAPGRGRIAVCMAGATLFASLGSSAPAMAAGRDCTYRFPAEGGTYTKTVMAADVICGGPGDDRVLRMQGGVFMGRRGADSVSKLVGGTFRGGKGPDAAGTLSGGVFRGGPGADLVHSVRPGGTFFGNEGPDYAFALDGGSFFGGANRDGVEEAYEASSYFMGAAGRDHVDIWWEGTFDGGPDVDSARWCFDGVALHVEHVTTDSCWTEE